MTSLPRILLGSLFALPISAQVPVAPSGSGTAQSPYLVDSLPNLAWISADSTRWNATCMQTSDIGADSTAHWNGNAGFRPIGNEMVPFGGTYHGHGHAISRLVVRRPGEQAVGLFGLVLGGRIDSLRLVDDTIRGGGEVGGLAGSLESGARIEECSASGTVVGDSGGFHVGGLVGAGGSGSTLQGCSSSGKVVGGKGSQSTGGLCGMWTSGMVRRCSSSSSVTGHLCVGGLVGQAYASVSISGSRSTGQVLGDDYVGGLVGTLASHSLVADCRASGRVSGSRSSQMVGGLVGSSEDSSILSRSFAQGIVWTKTLSSMVGGLVGQNSQSVVDSCYATGDVVSDTTAYEFGGLVGESTGSLSRIMECYATGLVWGGFGSDDVGGLVGSNKSGAYIGNCYATGTVVAGDHSYDVGGLAGSGTGDCSFYSAYATGEIVSGAASTYVGGIVGYLSGLSIPTSCRWNRESSRMDEAFGINPYGFTSISYATNGMRSPAALVQWDPTTWVVRQDSTYPSLVGVDNAPFAFPDTLSGSKIPLSRLLDNDYDFETGQANLVVQPTDLSTGWVEDGAIQFPSTVKEGDTMRIEYRVGEARPATGDTLWGDRARAFLVKRTTTAEKERKVVRSFSVRSEPGRLRFEYQLPVPGRVEIEILSLEGRRLRAGDLGFLSAGHRSSVVELPGQSGRLVLWRLRLGKDVLHSGAALLR